MNRPAVGDPPGRDLSRVWIAVLEAIAVVGAAQAGAAAVKTLRREGYEGRVVLVGAEPHLPYERPPLSKQVLRGEAVPDSTLLHDGDWYEERAVDLRLGRRAVRVDAATRAVELDDGSRVEADAVLLATGGRPRRLPAVEPSGRILELRTLDDAGRLREVVAAADRLVVVGAGFIGAEVASSARARGVDVVVLEALDVPLARVLGERVGAACGRLQRDHGVDLRTGVGVTGIEETADGAAVTTAGGDVVEGDAVVVGIGIVPNDGLAAASGIETDDGILVDARCRTSFEGVYAAGDVARHWHPRHDCHVRVEHYDNANRQAAVAATNLLGGDEEYDHVHWFWSDQFGASLQYAGHAENWDELIVRGDPDAGAFTAFYRSAGRLDAVFALDRPLDVRAGQRLIEFGVDLSAGDLADEDIDLMAIVREHMARARSGGSRP